MKIQTRDVDNFVKNPNKEIKAVLIYGPDEGLVRERITIIGKTIVDDLNDPFNVAEISGDKIKDDGAILSDELSSQSMMGGRRLIRLNNVNNNHTDVIKKSISSEFDNLLVIEAGDLNAKSSLRKLFEKEKTCAAVACYADDERSLGSIIDNQLRENNIRINMDAKNLLISNILGDRALARQEIEKLITYTISNPTNVIEIEDVINCIGNNSEMNMNDVAIHTASGNAKELDRTYNTLINEGISPIGILRTTQAYFRKLHLVKSKQQQGENTEWDIKSVFWKNQASFKSHLNNWSIDKLSMALDKLFETEEACKKTGSLPDVITIRILVALSMVGKSRR